MLVNTMTIAELKNYICGNSTCAYEARRADDDWVITVITKPRMGKEWNNHETQWVYIYIIT